MTIDYNELKKGGFLQQRQKGKYIVRFRSLAGNMSSDELRKIADLADRYGKGYVHITTRQGAEIPWVDFEDYNTIKKEILDAGLNTGTCGPRIRTMVSCPGNEVCRFGLMNARATAVELDKGFFGRQVPMKTKIGVSGCPNSCAKPQENDIGLVGAVEPVLVKDKCIGCGVCQKVCPNKAITMVDGLPVMDESLCLLEGNCIASCPVDAWQEKRKGYTLYLGGKIGRKPVLGKVVDRFIQEDEVVSTVETALNAFERLGQQGERLADTIGRVGVKGFKDEMDILKTEQRAGEPATDNDHESEVV